MGSFCFLFSHVKDPTTQLVCSGTQGVHGDGGRRIEQINLREITFTSATLPPQLGLLAQLTSFDISTTDDAVSGELGPMTQQRMFYCFAT